MKGKQKRSPMLRMLAMLLAMSMMFTSTGFQVMAQEVTAEQQAAEAAAARAAEEAAAKAQAEAARIAAEQQAAAEAAARAAAEKAAAEEAARIAAEQQAAAEAAARAAAEQQAAEAAAAEAAARAAAEQQAAEERAAAEAAAKAAAEQAAKDAAAARAAQEAMAANSNKDAQNIPSAPAAEKSDSTSKESEPVEGGKLVLATDSKSVQNAGEAKLKVEYGLGAGSEVKEVVTKLYVKNADVKLTQFDENGKFVEPGSNRTFTLKGEGAERYVEYKLQAGEHFKQEFHFVVETAKAGETVTFEVVFQTEGKLPEEKDVQKTAAVVTYTAPEKDAETEATETEAAESEETVVQNVVAFTATAGALVTVEGVDATNATAMAKNGTIYFYIHVTDGFELTEVLVDGYIPARTTGNAGEYIIENIKTNETIVSVTTKAIETEAPQTEAIEIIETEAPVVETEAETETVIETETEIETEVETEAATEIETEVETEAATEIETEVETEVETEIETEVETEVEYGTEFVYEDGSVIIKATASEEAKLPKDAKLVAVRMAEGSAFYNDAVATAESQLGSNDTAAYVCWDVYFEVNGERVEPDAGFVSVTMSFKKAVFEEYEVEEAADVSVIHINEETGVAEDVTAGVSVSDGDVDQLGFTTDSFSPILLMLDGAVDETVDLYVAAEYKVIEPGDNYNVFYQISMDESGNDIYDGEELSRDATLYLIMNYEFVNPNAFPTEDDCSGWTWQVPTESFKNSGLILDEMASSGAIIDDNGVQAGTYTVDDKYKVTFNYYPEWVVDHSSELSGSFTMKMHIDEKGTADDGSIDLELPGDVKHTIILENSDLSAAKSYTVNEDGNLVFKIVVTSEKANTTNVVITDVMTGDLHFTDETVFSAVDSKNNPVSITVNRDGDQKATITIPKVEVDNPVTITYTVSPYNKETGLLGTGTNTATGTGTGVGDGTGTQPGFGDTGVTFEPDNNILTKASEQDKEKNRIIYTIKVNELAQNLDPDKDTLVLVDTLDANVSYVFGSATVLMHTEKGTESLEGALQYSDENGVEVLTFTVPDSASIVITYEVSVNGKTGDELTVVNTVSLEGVVDKESSTEDKFLISSSGATIQGKSGVVKFLKISHYGANTLKGAEFELYEASLDDGKAVSSTPYYTATSQSSGFVQFGDNASSGKKIASNKLYYFVEKTAPNGYIKDTNKYYFIVDASTESLAKVQALKNKGIIVQTIADKENLQTLKNVSIPETTKTAFTAKKNVDGAAATGNAFEFKQEFMGYTPKTNGYVPGVNGTSTAAPTYATQTKRNNSGTITFDDVVFEFEGTYKFKITEVAKDGYYCDSNMYIATVVVERDETNGNLKIKSTTLTKGTTESNQKSTDKVVFNNVTKTGFTLTKTTTEPVKNATTFTFTVTGSNFLSGTSFKDVKQSGADSISLSNSNKTITVKVTVPAGSSSKTVTFTNIPAGAKITVTEASKAGWSVVTSGSNLTINKVAANASSNAITVKNEYKSESSWTPTATKTLTGRPYRSGEKFNFEIREGNTVIATGSNSANGKITFVEPGTTKTFVKKYTQADAGKTFTYTIREVAGAAETGMTYDSTVYTVTVKVTDDGAGNLTAAASYKANGTNVNSVSFTNTYVASGSWTPTANKAMTEGAKYDGSVFQFGVYDSNGREVSTGTKAESDSTIQFTAINYTQADIGTKTYTIKEKTGDRPDIKYDETEYTVVVTIVDKGNGVIGADESSIQYKKDGKTITASDLVFTNAYGASGQGSISGTKILVNKEMKAGDFTFGLFYDQAGNNPVKVNAKDIIDANGTAITATNNADGSFTLKTPKYDQDDITPVNEPLVYYVRELNTGISGVTYSNAAYKVFVTIKDAGSGHLTVTGAVENGVQISFTNTYNATGSLNLTAKKTVDGRKDVPSIFDFSLYNITNGNKVLIETVGNDAAGVTFSPITYSKNDVPNGSATFTYLMVEQGGSNLGYDYTSKQYKIVAVVTDSGNGTFNIAKTVYESVDGAWVEYKANNKVPVFENTYRASGSAVIEGLKSLNNHDLADKQFGFELYRIENYGTANRKDTLIETVRNDENGKFTFSELTFNQYQVGDNYFAVKEVNEGAAGYTYFSGEKIVKVHVKDNGNGTLTTTVTPNGINGTNPLEIVNTYTATGSIAFEALKTLNGRALEANQFTFTLSGDGISTQTKKNNLNGKVVFDAISYDQSDIGKTYTYTVTEKNEGKAGYTYSENRYEVTVTVVDNHDGTLSTPHTIKLNGEKYNGEVPEFANEYHANGKVTLNGVKELIGGEKELKAEDFTFTLSEVTLDESGNVTDAETPLETVSNEANGNFSFTTIHYTETGKHVYRVREVNEGKAGYEYDDTVIEVTVTVTDNGNGTLTATPNINGKQIKFVNEYSVDGGFIPEATKVVNGHVLNEGQFSFTLTGHGINETKTNDETGHVKFSKIKYDQGDIGKTFTYQIKEVKGSLPGYKYSDVVYDLVVTVEDNNGEELIVTPKYYLASDVNHTNETTAEFINTYSAKESIVIGGTKTLTPAKRALDEGIFSFQMTYDQEGTKPVLGADGNPLVVTNDADGNFTFPAITYTQEDVKETGTYTVDYYVSEVPNPEDKVYTYSDVIYKVTVLVTDKHDGTLNVEKTIKNLNTNKGTEAIVFTNHYNAKGELNLTAEKILVTGSEEIKLKDGQFTFELAEIAGKNHKQEVTNKADGSVTFAAIKYDENDIGNTYTYTVSEHYGNKDGFSYSNELYIVHVSISDNLDGTLKVDKQIINKYGKVVEEIEFTNEYHANGTLKLEALKHLHGTEMSADQFGFELRDISGKVLQTKTNDANGRIVFEEIAYTESAIGTHVYTINETNTENEPGGYTYDETIFTVTVTVADNGDGTLNVSKKITKPNKEGAAVEVNEAIFENIYGASCELEIPAIKVLEGTALKDNQFMFSLKGTGAVSGVELTAGNIGGTVTLGKLVYTEADAGQTYTYILREMIPEEKAPGYTYDESIYHVVVSITDNGDGSMDADYTIYKVTGPAGDPQKVKVDDAVFTNEYHAYGELNLEAIKTLLGRELEEGKFTFTLTGEGQNQTKTNNANGKVVFDAIAYDLDDINKPFTYTVAEIDGQEDGYTYSKEVYTVEVMVTDNGDGTLSAVPTYTNSAEKTVDEMEFVNAYEAAGGIVLEAQKKLNADLVDMTLEEVAGRFEFVVVDEDGNKVATGTNAADGTVTFSEITYETSVKDGEVNTSDLGEHVYTVKEVVVDGDTVIYDDTLYTVKVLVTDETDDAVLEAKVVEIIKDNETVEAVEFVNDFTKVEISKQILGDSEAKELAGATLQIRDKDGTVVLEWETGETVMYEEDLLNAGETYTLVETASPSGYKIAEPIPIKVSEDGSVDKIVMTDAPVEMKIRKVDESTGKALAGAEFEVHKGTKDLYEEAIAENVYGEELKLTVTGEAEKDVLKGLMVGSYVLVETAAPTGFVKLADPIPFTVTENMTTDVVLEDIVNTATDVTLIKKDALTGKVLPGAELKVVAVNEDGTLAEEPAVTFYGEELAWTTKDETGKSFRGLAVGTYALVETEAPDGYTVAEPIIFTMNEDGTVTVDGKEVTAVEMTNEPANLTVIKIDAEGKLAGALIGAEFQLRKANEVTEDSVDEPTTGSKDLYAEEAAVNVYGTPLVLRITGNTEKDTFRGILPGTYYLVETMAPKGFTIADPVKVVIEKNQPVADQQTIIVKDTPTEVVVSKRDLTNEAELIGAELMIVKVEDGVITEELAKSVYSDQVMKWTSDGTDHVVKGLLVGDYALVETEAPDGYTIAEPIIFTVKDDGTVSYVATTPDVKKDGADDITPFARRKPVVNPDATVSEIVTGGNKVVMKNDPVRVLITKAEFTKDNEVIPLNGACLEIREMVIENGEKRVGDIVSNIYGEKLRFVSKDHAIELKGIKNGTYYLVETDAPDGYVIADPVEITIEDDMKVGQKPEFVMEDCPTEVVISKVDITTADQELPGATLQILKKVTSTDEEGNATEEYVVAETIFGEKLEWVSGSEPKKITGLKDGTYILREVAAPAGYSVAKDIEFTLTEDMHVENKVVVENYPTETIISKRAMLGIQELPGAELQVLNADGEVAVTVYGEVLEWVSGEEERVFKGLAAGTYTLHEVKSPAGYALAEDIEFSVGTDGVVKVGEVTEVIMRDDTTKVYISKMDVTNNAELPGAHLILKDAEGNVMADWITTGKPKQIIGELIAGETYTLTEVSAPAGYDIAKDITFTVNADGLIQTVVMEDKVSDGKGSIAVQKLVMQDGRYIPIDYTFYVALFEDEECTKRISSVKPLFVNAAYSTSTIFTNLQYGTYYVAETDEMGNAITSGLMIESNQVIDGKVELTPEGATAKSTIINHVTGFREDYYKDGKVSINKIVMRDGVKKNVTDTFYFALFIDPELTMMADAGIVSLDFKNQSQGSVSFEEVPYGTYYLAETDENGVPVDSKYKYTSTIDSSYVSISADNKTAVRSVVNSLPPTPPTPPTTPPGDSPKTGDSTPILPYMLAMLSAVTVFAGALFGKRRRRTTK